MASTVTLFLCGDVMLGRGVDQVFRHSSSPEIHEQALKSALDYVALAERINGPIPREVEDAYVWGDVLATLEQIAPDVRIINLETAITTSGEWEPKGINYRMHPANVGVLTAAGTDCCVLANNHVLDWGEAGLVETLATVQDVAVQTVGAGATKIEAEAPAILDLERGGRVLVFAAGTSSSGVPPHWSAGSDRPGVAYLSELSERAVDRVAARVARVKQPGDIVVFSIHWGGNWGYPIPRPHRSFARRLVDQAGVDVVHGHSSHHAKGIEVYQDRLILYGCGDFLNDYEGISGYEQYRDDLAVAYFPTLDPSTGRLLRLEMAPMQIRNFRLNRATDEDTRWLAEVLTREGAPMGTAVEVDGGVLRLTW